MAYFKQVRNDEYGNPIFYESEQDLRNLIYYATSKSIWTECFNLFPLGAESYAEQFIYLQRCRGKEMSTRALHFILSFDTNSWEWQMYRDKVIGCINVVHRTLMCQGIGEFQVIYCVHDNGKNRHIHIIMNPVNINTSKLFHWGIGDYYKFTKELAIELFSKFGVALTGVSFVGSDNKLHFAQNTPVLYENREFPWDPHMRKSLS